MYTNLRTNLPKVVMGYPDYPIPDAPESYLTRTQILDFLNSYCDHFTLRQYIQLRHNVQLVEPTNGERKWSIRVKDLQKNAVVNESFDAVMVDMLREEEDELEKREMEGLQKMHFHMMGPKQSDYYDDLAE